jgi:hypothetical protein
MTPAQYNALVEQRDLYESLKEHGIAQLCCMYYNAHSGKSTRKLSVEDFSAFRRSTGSEETDEELVRKINEFASLYGG